MMDRRQMPSAMPADRAEVLSDQVDFEDRLAWNAARNRLLRQARKHLAQPQPEQEPKDDPHAA